MRRKPQKLILAVLPSVYGYSGDTVNEMMLLSSLCKKVDFCYVFTTLSPFQMIKFRGLGPDKPENVRVFTFITPPRPNFLISHILRIFYSYVFVLLILISGLWRKLNLIYIREATFAVAFLSVRVLAKKTIVKIPTILEDEIVHKGLAKCLAYKIIHFTERLALSKAKKVAFHSTYHARELIKRRRYLREEGFIIVPPGVILSQIANIRERCQVKSDDANFKVGYIGMLSPHQGVDLLVKALAILKTTSPDVNLRLTVIGDGPLKRDIENFCRKRKIPCEMTGFIPHHEALARLCEFDVLVAPRRRTYVTETIIPIKIVEAWALGVPVIVTRHKAFEASGYRDLEDVVYCEPEPRDIAEKILFLLHHKELQEKMRRKGPELAKNFDYDITAERLLM